MSNFFKKGTYPPFMVDSITKGTPEDADVLILGIPYDRTSSFGKGSDKGPEAILECLDSQIELYDRISGWSPARNMRIGELILPEIQNLEPEAMVKEVSKEIQKRREKKQFTLVLGGEHSIVAGILDSWKDRSDRITILHIDAHLDLREDDSDYNDHPSKWAHSCVMKRALDNKFKIVSVGIRAYADFEMKTAQENKMPIFEWPRKENEGLINSIIKEIKGDKVYLSLDVDGIDPSHMPATGTPVQGGLSWQFVLDLLKAVFTRKTVVGADIVEVAPRDYDRITEYGAAQLAYSMIGLKFKEKFDR